MPAGTATTFPTSEGGVDCSRALLIMPSLLELQFRPTGHPMNAKGASTVDNNVFFMCGSGTQSALSSEEYLSCILANLVFYRTDNLRR